MREGKRQKILDEIYAKLPNVSCKGLCHRHCAAAPAFPIELERLEKAAKRSLPVLVELPGGAKALSVSSENLDCPVLLMRRCMAYDARPLICRLFGVAEGMPCPHGCKPERVVTNQEVVDIQRTMEKL